MHIYLYVYIVPVTYNLISILEHTCFPPDRFPLALAENASTAIKTPSANEDDRIFVLFPFSRPVARKSYQRQTHGVVYKTR